MVTNQDDSKSPRRRFFLMLGGVSAAVVAGVGALPGLGPLLDPLIRKTRTAGGWFNVGEARSLSKRPIALPVVGEQVDAWTRTKNKQLGTVWVAEGSEGKPVALTAECPHLGCRIGYNADKDIFICPCHDSGFKRDGSVEWGPSPRGMDALEARVVDGKVEVEFKRFQTQVSDKVEIG